MKNLNLSSNKKVKNEPFFSPFWKSSVFEPNGSNSNGNSSKNPEFSSNYSASRSSPIITDLSNVNPISFLWEKDQNSQGGSSKDLKYDPNAKLRQVVDELMPQNTWSAYGSSPKYFIKLEIDAKYQMCSSIVSDLEP